MTAGLERFRALPESEGRVLLLIDAFSGTAERPRELEGRVKLAKLDFLLRYPRYLTRVLTARGATPRTLAQVGSDSNPLHDRMIRYRYGPWDPSYYAVLGSLIGRGLVETIPIPRGIGYRTSARGREVALGLEEEYGWEVVSDRAKVLRRHLDLAGTTLKNLLYEHIPEMSGAVWHNEL